MPGIQSERHEIQRGWPDGARNAREPSEAGSSVAVDGVMAGIDCLQPDTNGAACFPHLAQLD